MSFVYSARRAAALLAVVAAGACSDSMGPTIDHVDAQAAASKVEPVINVMEQPALTSFGSLGAIPGVPGSASANAMTAVTQLTKMAAKGRLDRSPLLARTLAPSLARSAPPVIPSADRGRIYTYNETTEQYEGAASAQAPTNGVRIVLYAIDPLSGLPASPLVDVGHVDLIDQGNDVEDRLAVVLVRKSDGVELLDYAITHTLTASNESFSISGSANNGITVVNFSLEGSASETAANITFDLAVPSQSFTLHVGMDANFVTGQGTVDMALGYDGHTLTYVVTVGPTSASGEIKFDGMRYVSYSATFDPETGETTSETFVKANGGQLNDAEVAEIMGVFLNAIIIEAFWAGLLWPVGAVAPAV